MRYIMMVLCLCCYGCDVGIDEYSSGAEKKRRIEQVIEWERECPELKPCVKQVFEDSKLRMPEYHYIKRMYHEVLIDRAKNRMEKNEKPTVR